MSLGEAVLAGTHWSGVTGMGASPLAGWGTQPSFYWREKIQRYSTPNEGRKLGDEIPCVSAFRYLGGGHPWRGGFSFIPNHTPSHGPFCLSVLFFCHKCELFVVLDKWG